MELGWIDFSKTERSKVFDYVKSTPYLMSFMCDYQLKRYIEKYFAEHPDEINKVNKDTFWLKRRTLDRYDKVSNNNARLERVMSHIFKDNAELLLWVPPARPYYQPQGVFNRGPLKAPHLLTFC